MAQLAAAPRQPVADDRFDRFDDQRTRSALRAVRLLTGGYLTLSVLTMAAVVLLRGHPSLVTGAVWTRTTIVTVSALLTFAFAAGTARGSRGAFRRLRIVSTVMVIAIVVIVAIPGDFPMWLKIEQGACGLLLLGVVRLVRGRHLRGLFAATAE
ncbi:hypothetical protein I6A60_34260 [Frankia sp. AgB1.9]|uniref:hypothetical protein n=1 Tax=unclassified Frankia TaxID=2632575 RepID=UPI001932BD11|nr:MULTISPECIES: hypothetical protein [unclassified Frankia]MBL7486965.1 hypothetical protein [Frankia sp. AgW1.1]MBL7552879.1 hypothetical protein [Frankia sp. AgB1.9]MBL7625383.1 hypothetical protein [Frankia sp. AgB1.8]